MGYAIVVAAVGFILGLITTSLSTVLIFACSYVIECKGVSIWTGLVSLFVGMFILTISSFICIHCREDEYTQLL
jgi:hypothetical protein